MSNFILIHGSWHGAWCWYKVVPRLRALGHYVDAIDLPGHGREWTEPAEVSLDSYVDAIGRAIERAPGQTHLVAHSRGGVPASQAAERYCEKVDQLVYLAAYLLADGESVLDQAVQDSESLVIPNLEFDPDGNWDMLKSQAFETALYADCPPEDVALAHLLLTREPALPSRTPISVSPDRYGRIPRTYIELLQDRAVSPSLQRSMHQAVGCDEVRSIEASHSAYFSTPDELAASLDEIATLVDWPSRPRRITNTAPGRPPTTST